MAKAEQPRTLREMGAMFEGSGWPEGDAIVSETLERCHASDAVAVVEELIEQVKDMQMASHFRTDQSPKLRKGSRISGDLSEAEFKRQSLLIQLHAARNDLAIFFSRLGNIILNIEMSGRELGEVDSLHAGTTPENSIGTGDSVTQES